MSREEAYTEYAAVTWPRLVRAALLLGCPLPDAEDLVQNTLVKVYVRWNKISRLDHPNAYVHRILVNTFLSDRKRAWHGELPVPEFPEQVASAEVHHVESADAVRRVLAVLPVDQRAVVVLRHYLGLSEAQAAEALGIAPGTVKSRLSRAMKTLRTDPAVRSLEGIHD